MNRETTFSTPAKVSEKIHIFYGSKNANSDSEVVSFEMKILYCTKLCLYNISVERSLGQLANDYFLLSKYLSKII